MFDSRLLTSSMLARGCPKLDKLVYGLPEAHPSLQWSVAFRLLGVYRWEIDGSVSYSHRQATQFAQHCLRELAGDWWKNSLLKQPKLSGGMGFPVARLAHWSANHSLVIKELSAQESATRVATDIETTVLPFVASVQTEHRFLELILANGKPTEWLYCQTLQRFAQAVWLCAKLGHGFEPALLALERERHLMQGQLHDLSVDVYAERVLLAVQDSG